MRIRYQVVRRLLSVIKRHYQNPLGNPGEPLEIVLEVRSGGVESVDERSVGHQ